MVKQFLESLKLLSWGFFKRIYWLLPTLVLDPFDIIERLTGWEYNMPIYIIWLLFSTGCLIAITLTYHELRIKTSNTTQKHELLDELGAFLEEGRQLQIQCGDENQPPPELAAENWNKRLEEFVSENFGAHYVSRLRSGAGLPIILLDG